MRKLAVVLLCCLVLGGCNKKSEQEAAEDELIASVTMPQVGTAPDTMPPVSTSSAATTATTATVTNTSTGLPDLGTPPTAQPAMPRPQVDRIVDTLYAWPPNLIPLIAKEHPELVYFNTHEAAKWAAIRKQQGWRVIETIQVPGRAEPRLDPTKPQPKKPHDLFIDFPRVMIVYRKN